MRLPWLGKGDPTISQIVAEVTMRPGIAVLSEWSKQLLVSTVGVWVPVTPMKPPMSSDAATMRWQGTSGAYGFRRSACTYGRQADS